MRCVAGVAAVLLLTGAASAQQERYVTVINQTDAAVEYFYAAACGGGGWGKDRLGAKEIIDPGVRRQFKLSAAREGCCYDLRAKLHTGATQQKLNVDLCREPEWIIR